MATRSDHVTRSTRKKLLDPETDADMAKILRILEESHTDCDISDDDSERQPQQLNSTAFEESDTESDELLNVIW